MKMNNNNNKNKDLETLLRQKEEALKELHKLLGFSSKKTHNLF